MNEFIAAFPSDFWWSALPVFLGWLSMWLAPLIAPLFVVIRRRKTMRRRMLFVVLVPAMVYGALLFLAVLVQTPLAFYFNAIYPTLSVNGFSHLTWFERVYSLWTQWWLLVLPAVILMTSFALVRYLIKRWEPIVAALDLEAAPVSIPDR